MAHKRTPYAITVRSMLTGTDWHMVRWCRDDNKLEVLNRAQEHIERTNPHHKGHTRIARCYPADATQIVGHFVRMMRARPGAR